MKPTDWDAYYNKPYKTATLTRRITGHVITSLMQRYGCCDRSMTMIELGGANSCFYTLVNEKIRPREYVVVDNNRIGLEKFKERVNDRHVKSVTDDVLHLTYAQTADFVYSVGLIEHFGPEDTARAIEAHFRLLKPGGIALMTFPTPTWLYGATRWCSEQLGLWIFHDERPLPLREVLATAEKHGDLLHQRIIWSIFLTQGVVVLRRKN